MRIIVSKTIAAPVERVRDLMCDFGGMHRWHPAFDHCEVEGRGVGAVRTLRMGEVQLRDRLQAVSEDGQGFSYAQIEGPLALASHCAFLCVHSNPDGSTTADWIAEIVAAKDVPPKAVEALYRGLFESGLAVAKSHLEKKTLTKAA